MTLPPDAFLAPLVCPAGGAVSAVALLLPDSVADHCREAGLRVLIGTVNGTPLRRAVRPVGDGRLGLALGRAFLRDVGASLGDIVEVEIDYLASQLASNLKARRAFEALQERERRSVCMRVERGASEAVRTRRAEAAVAALREAA